MAVRVSPALFAALAITVLSAAIPAALASRQLKQAPGAQFVVLELNVDSKGGTCADWYAGPIAVYENALRSYNLVGEVAKGCRQVARTVHLAEILTAEPGANLLSDDPKKVPEGWAEIRNLNVTNRVTLDVSFMLAQPNPGTVQGTYATLNANVRSGDYAAKVAGAQYPLLKAQVYVESITGNLVLSG